MRRSLVGAVVVAALALGHAGADANVVASEWGSTRQEVCLFWQQPDGAERWIVSLCGVHDVDANGKPTSRVEAERLSWTCDEQSGSCSDVVSEIYAASAEATELVIDADAGSAVIDLVLAGDDEGDACDARAVATATSRDGSVDPFPTVVLRTNPINPSVSVEQGLTTTTAGAFRSGLLAGAAASTSRDGRTDRYAQGPGSVCDWVDDEMSFWGYLAAEGESGRVVGVVPPYLPPPFPLPSP